MSHLTSSQSRFVTRETMNRLVRDITDIFKNPLVDEGIYYQHDDTDMLKGYAMIIGPQDTPYENGMYLFLLDFPENYPQQPPKLTYMTQDGNTRFNPNLYVSGKVCLSILNTWRGESWTSSQTIRSVLMTLITVLNDEPLLNEPGIKNTHIDFARYNHYIRYKNYMIAINGMLSQRYLPNAFRMFFPFIKAHILEKSSNIVEKMKEYRTQMNEENIKNIIVSLYNMRTTLELDHMIEQFQTLIDAYTRTSNSGADVGAGVGAGTGAGTGAGSLEYAGIDNNNS